VKSGAGNAADKGARSVRRYAQRVGDRSHAVWMPQRLYAARRRAVGSGGSGRATKTRCVYVLPSLPTEGTSEEAEGRLREPYVVAVSARTRERVRRTVAVVAPASARGSKRAAQCAKWRGFGVATPRREPACLRRYNRHDRREFQQEAVVPTPDPEPEKCVAAKRSTVGGEGNHARRHPRTWNRPQRTQHWR